MTVSNEVASVASATVIASQDEQKRRRAEYNRVYNNVNSERIKKIKAEKYKEKRNEILLKRSEYYSKNKSKCSEAMKAYRERTKEVRQSRERKYREENRERRNQQRKEYYWKNRESQLQKAKESAGRRPWRNMLQAARCRALKKGLPFTIGDAWFKERWTGFCELTGIKFGNSGKGPSRYSPSVDRIDPAKGYTPENSRIILNRLNSMKGDDPNDEFMIELAMALVNRHGN